MTDHHASNDTPTRWSILRAASAGEAAARDEFAATYAPLIRAYLEHRWRGSPLLGDAADSAQEVFVECMKPGGALERAEADRGDFRALLYGVVRNVARRVEERRAFELERGGAASVHLDDLPDRALALSRVFDRCWAQAIVQEAARLHEHRADSADEAARTRFQILQLRHHDGLPIRKIAARLRIAEVDRVHNAYRRARREFRACLREVVAMRTGVGPDAVDDECQRVLDMLAS